MQGVKEPFPPEKPTAAARQSFSILNSLLRERSGNAGGLLGEQPLAIMVPSKRNRLEEFLEE